MLGGSPQDPAGAGLQEAERFRLGNRDSPDHHAGARLRQPNLTQPFENRLNPEGLVHHQYVRPVAADRLQRPRQRIRGLLVLEIRVRRQQRANALGRDGLGVADRDCPCCGRRGHVASDWSESQRASPPGWFTVRRPVLRDFSSTDAMSSRALSPRAMVFQNPCSRSAVSSIRVHHSLIPVRNTLAE